MSLVLIGSNLHYLQFFITSITVTKFTRRLWYLIKWCQKCRMLPEKRHGDIEVTDRDRVVFCSALLKVLGKRRENSKWFAKKKELNSVLPKDIARKVRNRTWWITTAICRIPAKLNTSSYPEIDLFMVFFNFWQGQVGENPSTLLKRAS